MRSYTPVVDSSETIPESRPKWAVYTRFQTKTAKTIPLGRHIPIPIWLIKGSTHSHLGPNNTLLGKQWHPHSLGFSRHMKTKLEVSDCRLECSQISHSCERKLERKRLAERYTDCSSVFKMFLFLLFTFVVSSINHKETLWWINNNNKLYLQDHNKVLQYCKSYLKLIIDSL